MSINKLTQSGVDIVGLFPKDWEIKRLKYLCKIQTGGQDTQDAVDDGEFPFYVRSPYVERIDKFDFDGEAVLMAGDGVGAGKVFHYTNGKFGCHQRVYIINSYRGVSGKFLYYYMKNLFSIEIEKGSAKSTVDSVRLPMLQNFPICLPKIREQKHISSFLDSRIGLIDNIINDLENQIEILEKYKNSVITEAVTKGLNSNVQMKFIDFLWGVNAPVHWDIKKIKNVCLIERGSSPRPIDSYLSDDVRDMNWIKISDTIKGSKYITNAEQQIIKTGISKSRKVFKGDLLLTNSMSFGQPYILKIDGCIHDGWVVFSNYKGIDKEFLYYVLMSDACLTQFKVSVSGAVVSNLNIDKIKETKILVPKINEQIEIVRFLDKKCYKIDSIIEDKKSQVETIKKYKNSLIYEYVTGKKRVSQGDVNE